MMAFSDKEREVLEFIDGNGGSSAEDVPRTAFGDDVVSLLDQIGAAHVQRETFPLEETQATAAAARMPKEVVTVWVLTDDSREDIRATE
jgi:hypothetical protein